MKTKALVLVALSSVTMLSANQYGYGYAQPSCPNGNCPYQGQGSGQVYYQGNPQQNYNQNPSYYQNSNGYNGGNYNAPVNANNQYRDGNYEPSNNNSSRNQYQNAHQDRNGYNNPSYDNNANNSNYTNDRRGMKEIKSVTDEEIAKQVHEAVSSNWLSSGYPDVTFDVNNGTVNLRGNVKTQDERTKLETAVKKIEGVKQVNNEVTVKDNKTASNSYYKNNVANNDSKMKKTETTFPQDTASTDSDRLINSKIRNKLNGWFTTGYETIVLNTSNGIVTISGFVEKADDIQKVNKDVKAVDGVKTVNNKVSIQKK